MPDITLERRDAKGKVVETTTVATPSQAVAAKWRGFTIVEAPKVETSKSPKPSA